LINEIIRKVSQGMIGRMCNEQDNVKRLLEYVALAPHGNHLEIGTLFGGSAICVALLKNELNVVGDTYCVDPFDGYYKGTEYESVNDPICDIPVDLQTVENNAELFDVYLEIIKAKSNPFPIEGIRFSTAYVDGDHWGENPRIDIENCMKVTDNFIVIDNYDAQHPDVMRACEKHYRDWWMAYRGGITCVLAKI